MMESNNQYRNSARSSFLLLKSPRDIFAERIEVGGASHEMSVIFVS